jgi:hypothetical protein
VVVCSVSYEPIAGHRPSTPLVKYLSEGRGMEMALAPVAGTRLLASQSPHATGSSSRTPSCAKLSFRRRRRIAV